MKTNFEFLFSHYSTLFDYKLGLLNHFLSIFCLFLPLFATLNQIFWLFTQPDVLRIKEVPPRRDLGKSLISLLSAVIRRFDVSIGLPTICIWNISLHFISILETPKRWYKSETQKSFHNSTITFYSLEDSHSWRLI